MATDLQKFRLEFLRKQRDGLYPSREALEKDAFYIAEESVKEGNMFVAIGLFSELGNTQRIKEIAELSLAKGEYADAVSAFKAIRDVKGITRAISVGEDIERSRGAFGHLLSHNSPLGSAMYDAIGSSLVNKINDSFDAWTEKKGIHLGYSHPIHQIATMAHELTDKYDVGIGVANGGLFGAYLFDMFGLPIDIAHAHRPSKLKQDSTADDVAFKWESNQPIHAIKDKRVLVIENDVSSGITSKRVLEELVVRGAKEVDIVLAAGPDSDAFKSNIENVPQGYNRVYFPSRFSYKNFDKVVERLEKTIR